MSKMSYLVIVDAAAERRRRLQDKDRGLKRLPEYQRTSGEQERSSSQL